MTRGRNAPMRNAPMSSEEITYWIVHDIAVHHSAMIRGAVPNFVAAWPYEQCRALRNDVGTRVMEFLASHRAGAYDGGSITAELILLIIVDLTTADLTIVDLITLNHTTPDHTIVAPIMGELIVTDHIKADLIAAGLPAELFPMAHHGGGSFVDGRSGMGSGFGHRSRGYEDEDDMADRIREMSSIREYDEY
ncbi:hypothetical protein MMC22_007292 [Lobaria immixta]|nr:hypothetical protein [Lobaria immixta]